MFVKSDSIRKNILIFPREGTGEAGMIEVKHNKQPEDVMTVRHPAGQWFEVYNKDNKL